MSARTYDVIETNGAPVKAWTRGVQFEEQAQAQVRGVAQLPFRARSYIVRGKGEMGAVGKGIVRVDVRG